jgi:hypothetical protein
MAKKMVAKKVSTKKGIVEKSTGEKYASKAAMKKHEKGESKADMMKEYGSKFKKGMR